MLQCVFHVLILLSNLNHAFHLLREPLPWHYGNTYCINICQSELATFNNISSLSSLDIMNDTNMIWFGLYGSSDNELQWSDSSNYDPIYWSNTGVWDTNITYQPSMNKQCIALKTNEMNNSAYLWQATYCDKKLYILCNKCSLPTYYLSPNLYTTLGADHFC
eukprot:285094_1